VAQSLNKCSFIGNLGNDPEIRYLPSGDALCSFTIACSESWKDKQTGEQKEKTEWVRFSAFGKLAEICGEYLKKGAKVYCEGKFTTRKYQAADGTDRYATEIKLENMLMLGSRPDGDGGERRNTNAGNGQQRQQQTRSAPPSGQRAGSAGRAPAGGGFDELDDDIPF
jgi:single-strand DNA-binding protein